MSPPSAGWRRGSVLLEILVGLVLLAVGLLGLAAATATIARQTEFAGARHRLAARAQNAMERRMAQFGTPPPPEDGASGYRLEWDVASPDTRQLRLVASLRWRSTIASDTLIMLLRP